MRIRRSLLSAPWKSLALLAPPLALALSACASDPGMGQERGRNPNLPRQSMDQSVTGPAPRDMPGGGRSSDPPKFKGKP